MMEKSHTWVWVMIVVLILALMVGGVATYDKHKNTKEAQAKAQELIAKLQAAGLPAPDEKTAVALFGTDGGFVAQDPGSALLQAQLASGFGNTGPASRSVIIDRDLLRAEAIVLEVYAPKKLAAYQEWLRTLKYGETQ